MENIHQKFMWRCLELAKMGFGNVAPNPMVGCVIVHQNKIIAEGYHQQYGHAHAEVNAFNAIPFEYQNLFNQTNVYVSLEPCSHFGKTPPCVDLLVKMKPKSVIIANQDTNPLVAGKGIEKLKNNGIEVITGVLEKEARQLNKRFFTFMEKKRPYIVLKWAMSKDFFIAKQNFEKTQISNPISKKIVHQWRTQEQGIMVGKNTALFDNPILNAREWIGKQPTRIILDRNLSLPLDLHIFDKSQPTIIYNFIKNQTEENLEYVKINIDTFWKDIFQDLYEKKIQSILVEGGTAILQDLLEKDLYDEIRIFQSDKTIEKGITAPILQKKFNQMIEIENDILYIFEKEI